MILYFSIRDVCLSETELSNSEQPNSKGKTIISRSQEKQKGTTKTIYVTNISQWETFSDLCADKLKCSVSARVNEFVKGDVIRMQGNGFVPVFNLESKSEELRKTLEKEKRLEAFLKSEKLEDQTILYEAFHDFTRGLGSDEGLMQNLPEIYEKLIDYKPSKEAEWLTLERLEIWLEYLELVLKRRAIRTELFEYRRNKRAAKGKAQF